jgi:hypothetical protein
VVSTQIGARRLTGRSITRERKRERERDRERERETERERESDQRCLELGNFLDRLKHAKHTGCHDP